MTTLLNPNPETITNVSPRLWGKCAWEFLDTVLIMYPRQDPSLEVQEACRHLLQSLRILLPCQDCRHHYNLFMDAHPIEPALQSRESLMQFYTDMRNDVASRMKAPLYRSVNDLWRQILSRLQLYTPPTPHSHRVRPPLTSRLSMKVNPIPPKPITTTTTSSNVFTGVPQKIKRGCNCGR